MLSAKDHFDSFIYLQKSQIHLFRIINSMLETCNLETMESREPVRRLATEHNKAHVG